MFRKGALDQDSKTALAGWTGMEFYFIVLPLCSRIKVTAAHTHTHTHAEQNPSKQSLWLMDSSEAQKSCEYP